MSTKGTDAKRTPSFSTLSLRDARGRAPEGSALAELLGCLSARSADVFLEGTYSYGDAIIESGALVLPSKSVRFPDASRPLAALLEGTAEVYIQPSTETEHTLTTIPLRVLRPGETFGVFEILDDLEQRQGQAHSRTLAGARSVQVAAGVRSVLPLFNTTGKVFRGNVARATKTSGVVPGNAATDLRQTLKILCPEAVQDWK